MQAMDIFEAYAQNALPTDEGYIISSFFKRGSAYSVYEVVAYSSVKDIFATEDSITFRTSGKKLFLLAEPSSYPQKTVEPYCRPQGDMVPFRFSETYHMLAKNHANIYFNKEPREAISAFTVFKPEGINFSYVFCADDNVFEIIEEFFAHTLYNDVSLPHSDALSIAKRVTKLCAQKLKPNPSKEY